MRKLRRRVLAILLAASLASQSMFVSASDLSEIAEVSEAVVNDVSGNEDVSGSDEVIVEDVSENEEEIKVPEETVDPAPQTPDVSDNEEEETIPEEEDVSEDETPAEDVSGSDVSAGEESLGEDTWYSLPEGYVVSDEEMANKKDLAANTITGLADAAEGIDYDKNIVIALCDTEEEALLIARSYGGELYSFGLGVAEILLADNVTVMEALQVSADTSLAMPTVYPNLYYQIETAEIEEYNYLSEEESEETEEEIEFSDEELSEIDSLAMDFYSDPYLKGSSGSMYQWHHDVIGSVYAWKKGYRGQGINVAVIDTGVVGGHSDMSVSAAYDCYSRTDGKAGYGADDNGHGSHCAGIIRGVANGKLGVGVAPSANIYSIKVLGANGGGSDTQIIRGLNLAYSLGIIDVISMSIGGKRYNSVYKEPIDNLYYAGIVFVASSGNDGGSDANYPGNLDHVICVGATDRNNKRADFSTYNSSVDVAAPGVDIPSLKYNSLNSYVLMSGTSMATPVVAGEVAVILSAADDLAALKGKTGKDRVDAVEKILKSSTISAGSGTGKGIPVLTKVFGMTDDSRNPGAPVIYATISEDRQSATVEIESKSVNTIYYTTDGRNPSYKDGKLVYGTEYTKQIELSGDDAARYTIKAIEVNSVGKVSKVTTKKITLVSKVQSISVSGCFFVAPGKSTTYKASVSPSYATNKKVIWSVEGTVPEGVKIDSKTGKLTVKSTVTEAESFYVVARAADNFGAYDSYRIVIKNNFIKSVKFASKSVSVSRTTADVTYDLVATGQFQSSSVIATPVAAEHFFWSSSNDSVASVDSNGKVTCYKGGSVKITAKAKDTSGKSASITLKVNQLATGVSLYGNDSLAPGTSASYSATVSPLGVSNKNVTWSISAATGVKIDAKKGKVTVNKTAPEQTFYVYATAKDGSGVVGYRKVKVAGGKVTGITLSEKSGYIFRNEGTFDSATKTHFIYTVNGTGSFASDVTISNSAPGLVSVTVEGSTVMLEATGTGTGTAKITVTSKDGTRKSATYTLSVREPVTAVNIASSKSGGGEFVTRGKSAGFTAKVVCEGKPYTTKVNWYAYSTNDYYSGVTVNSKGTVKADNKASSRSDTYKLIAVAADGSGAYAIYNITVVEPTSRMIAYKPVTVKRGSDSYAYALFSGGGYYYSPGDDGYYYPYYVSSSNPKCVAVKKNKIDTMQIGYYNIPCVSALVIGNKEGKSTVTIKFANGKSAKIKVTVK